MMNKKGHAGMVSHFAGMGGFDEKREWLIGQSIEDLEILLEELRSMSTLLNDAWSNFIVALIWQKKVQLRDDKLKELGL